VSQTDGQMDRQSERQTDRPHYHANSQPYCAQYDEIKNNNTAKCYQYNYIKHKEEKTANKCL